MDNGLWISPETANNIEREVRTLGTKILIEMQQGLPFHTKSGQPKN